MKLKGAEIICEALLREGVEVVFGHPGGAVLPLYDAFYKYSQIRHILVRHEQCGAHAADGYARATGKVGVCVATLGPGATNLITGTMGAKADSTTATWVWCASGRSFSMTSATSRSRVREAG